MRGFTLVEILIVLSLTVMLLGFVIPQFFNFNRRSFLNEQARLVEETLNEAQSMALSGVMGSETDFYRFQLTNPVGNYYQQIEILRGLKNGSTVGVKSYDLGCGVAVEESNPAHNWVSFETISGSVNSNHSGTVAFKVCLPNFGYQNITVDVSGKIIKGSYVEDSNACSTYSPGC